jgi:glycerol-3-phosphate acyltransferase PlsX
MSASSQQSHAAKKSGNGHHPAQPRLILDVMGGDHAPEANLLGALEALPEIEGELVLVGDEPAIRKALEPRRFRALQQALDVNVRIVHASETIDMGDSIRAVRSKPGASINVGCRMAAEDWQAHKQNRQHHPSAFISAGHSGAMMASALLNMGRLPHVERPAIAVKLPSLSPDGCVLLDVGANVDCKPEHLRDFAIMGALFAQVERHDLSLPRVGVLSNGEERSKGNELTRGALALIEAHPAFASREEAIGRFVGYSEGKEIFKGQVDVVVTDGFVGNLVLKSVEGLGSAVVTLLKGEAKTNPLNTAGFVMAAGAFKRLKAKLDYAEYGAAPLLGVAGYAFICHGRSKAKAIKNALLRTQSALKSEFVQRMELALGASARSGDAPHKEIS